MIAKQKKILMITNLHWDSSIQVGDHALARQYHMAGWKVGFVSDPVTPFHLLKGFELGDRFRNYIRGGIKSDDGAFWSYVPGSLVMPYNVPLLKSRWVHEAWHKTSLPNLVSKVRSAGFSEVDILYFRTAKQSFWLDAIKSSVSVFRMADNDAGFFDYNDRVRQREQDLIRKVDLAVYTAKPIKEHLDRLGSRESLYLPNGVDYELFAAQAAVPAEYRDMEGPIVVHVGSVLPERFDFALVEQIVERFPHVQFVFVGPDEELRRRLQPRANLHLLGRRPYVEVPGYMQHADAGLILLDVEKNPLLVNSTNPIKLYQYLASGLPVVSRRWQALDELAPPVTLAESRDDFVECLQRVLQAGPLKRETLRNYAKGFDWQSRFDLLNDRISSIVERKVAL